jgi:hypothetical protein
MDSSKERIWIAAPYIGGVSAVSRILGKKWEIASDINIRLLTDLDECMHISFETLMHFYRVGSIRSLPALHAKIYIVDESVIVTSANLTEAAFGKRYEMGVLLEGADAKDAISQFDFWWKNKSTAVLFKDIKELKSKCAKEEPDSKPGRKFSSLWNLPLPLKKKAKLSSQGKLADFDYFLQCYNDFSDIYSRHQRLRPQMPINLEIDGMLDYLFHHEGQPSSKYGRVLEETPIAPRQVKNLEAEVQLWAEKYKKWVAGGNDISWRQDRAKIIQTKLGPKFVLHIDRDDLKQVADCLNCMNSYAINKRRFLNPANNNLRTIRDNLHLLLHGEGDIKAKLVKCRDALNYFGDSSVQELVGFYDPVSYPIRNGNSNAGLRYFGYDVSI